MIDRSDSQQSLPSCDWILHPPGRRFLLQGIHGQRSYFMIPSILFISSAHVRRNILFSAGIVGRSYKIYICNLIAILYTIIVILV